MLKPYENYKDIAAPWLDVIPTSWQEKRIRELFAERRTKVSDKDFSPLSVSKKGVVPQLESAVKTDNGDNRKLVCKKDFVVNSRSDRKGSSGISDYDGSVSLINIVLQPRNDINEKYFHYLLRSNSFIEEFYRNGRGIVSDLWTTRYSEMKNIIVPLPTENEQDKMAHFLDWKCSDIHKVIKAKKKQIKILNEGKVAVINNAICPDYNYPINANGTKGLDQNAIPEGWGMFKLRDICRLNPSTLIEQKEISEDEKVLFLSMDKVEKNGLYDMESFRRYKEVKNGFSTFISNDVLLAKITPCFENGKGTWLYKMPTLIGCGTSEFIVLRANENVLPEYLFRITQSRYFRLLGERFMTGSAGQKRITPEFVKNFLIAIPDKDTQAKILEILRIDLSKIEFMIGKIQDEIAKIKEYHTRLISDVVTGKVDVRDVIIPSFESDVEEIDEADDVEEREDEVYADE